ncbi:MAG: hypothetical protein KDE69_07350 [Burkholderiaceae bacterium]|jgi:hypothetical protein|nr:hypothetical protein [Burkholderiaceae bacterium]MDP3136128.1 hypothetical protein [Burkholderiaceae bacterium]
MFVHVSSHGVVSLEAREDFRAFELRSELQGEALAHALHGVAERDGQGFAWVLAGWLEEQLTQQPPSPGWRTDFEAMLAYAQRQGWWRGPPAPCVRAHVHGA